MASVAELDVLIKSQIQGEAALKDFNKQMLEAGATAGLLYEVGKSLVDNYEAQQQALGDLSQAFSTQNESMGPDTIRQINAFLDANKQRIASSYDAEEAFAAATRAGFNFTDSMHLETEAMNLAIIQHKSMSEAMDELIKASQGSGKALLDLGIKESAIVDPVKALAEAQKAATRADLDKAVADRMLQEELDRLHGKHTITQADLDILADKKAKDLAATQADTEAHQKLAEAQAAAANNGSKFAEVQAIIDQRTQNADAKLTELDKDQRALNYDWAQFSTLTGPAVVGAIDEVVKAADVGVEILSEYIQIVEAIVKAPGKIGTALSTIGADLTSGIFGQAAGRAFPGQPGSGGGSAPQQPTWAPPIDVPGGGRISPGTPNVTVNVNGAQDPLATARTVAHVIRQAGQV